MPDRPDIPEERSKRCPTCNSPVADRFPSTAFEGEALGCADEWHLTDPQKPPTDTMRELVERGRRNKASHPDIPEEEAEGLALWHYNLTHDVGEKHGTPWVKASETEKAKSRNAARYRLAQLAPALRKQGVEEAEQKLQAAEARAANYDQDRREWQAAAERNLNAARDAEAERDQALAKGAEEEREQLRKALEDTKPGSPLYEAVRILERKGNMLLSTLALVMFRAAFDALDTPAPSESDRDYCPKCSSHTTRWCDCKGEPRIVTTNRPGGGA